MHTDFIYSEYLTSAGRHCRSIVWQIADDYAHATALLRLPGHCPMPAFRHIVDVPLIVRHAHATRDEVGNKQVINTHSITVLMYLSTFTPCNITSIDPKHV